MLFALLFSLLFLLIGGDTLFSDVDKYVRANVDDKARKTILIDLIGDEDKNAKEADISKKKFIRLNNRLFTDRHTTITEFERLHSNFLKTEREITAYNIDRMYVYKEQVTISEWENIAADIREDALKYASITGKSVKSLNKYFDKLERKIRSIIKDERQINAVMVAFDDFKTSFVNDYIGGNEQQFATYSCAYENKKSLLTKVFNKQYDYLEQSLTNYIIFHQALVSNSTPQEWRRLNNWMKISL